MRLFAAMFLAPAIMLSDLSPAAAEARIALVIGNSNYELIPPLRNPRNDAVLMSATLRRVGFEVIEENDTDLRSLARAIRQFGKTLRAGGQDAVGLFFYAGHGVQARGSNYLIPLGATIEDEADLEIEALSAASVLAQMESAGNALNLVILDACRNNPFKTNFRSAGRGLARMNAPSGSLVAYSAAPGQVATDGHGTNSPYSSALSKVIRTPGLSIEQVFKRVRVEVEKTTGGQQTPWEESSMKGDFYFLRGQAASDATASTAQQAKPSATTQNSIRAQQDSLFWESIKDSTARGDYEAYLEQFPDGTFAPLARVRLSRSAPTEPQSGSERQSAKLPVDQVEGAKFTPEQVSEYLSERTSELRARSFRFLRAQNAVGAGYRMVGIMKWRVLSTFADEFVIETSFELNDVRYGSLPRSYRLRGQIIESDFRFLEVIADPG